MKVLKECLALLVFMLVFLIVHTWVSINQENNSYHVCRSYTEWWDKGIRYAVCEAKDHLRVPKNKVKSV